MTQFNESGATRSRTVLDFHEWLSKTGNVFMASNERMIDAYERLNTPPQLKSSGTAGTTGKKKRKRIQVVKIEKIGSWGK